MLIIFESILPIFLLVMLGTALRRISLIDGSFWGGLEQFSYYVLFPALLFETLAETDFSALDSGMVSLSSLIAVAIMSAVSLAIWPVFRASGMTGARFTSVFQTSTRWNGFIALAIAEKLAGAAGLSVIAIIMATIILPINLTNVGVLVWFSGQPRQISTFVVRILTNPIILGALAGTAVNLAGVEIYSPLMTTIDLLARASLGLGLIVVGAGLRLADVRRAEPSLIFSVCMKLLIFPAVSVALALYFGLGATTVLMIALGASVPTAMNGYVLARQMGGDAEFYAAAATAQTIIAFFTIPAVLFLAAQAAGG